MEEITEYLTEARPVQAVMMNESWGVGIFFGENNHDTISPFLFFVFCFLLSILKPIITHIVTHFKSRRREETSKTETSNPIILTFL